MLDLQKRQKASIDGCFFRVCIKVYTYEDKLFLPDKSALSQFCVDLTARAEYGSIDPVIGREAEVQRVVQILCRRSKCNPILLGEAGVGKTAIAEGLAISIADGNVPFFLMVGCLLFFPRKMSFNFCDSMQWSLKIVVSLN